MNFLKNNLLEILTNNSLKASEMEALCSKAMCYSPEKAEMLVPRENSELYGGLEEQALSTPFKDYFTILNDLSAKDSLVDMGAGYCKGEVLALALESKVSVRSLEVSPERLEYAQKWATQLNLDFKSNETFDILSRELPLADAYFVYLPLGALILKPLERLLRAGEKGHSFCLYVVESHGDMFDFFEGLSHWFKLEKVLPASAQRHRSGIRKYRFTSSPFEVGNINSPEFIYELVANYAENPKVSLIKEGVGVEVELRSLLPIKYNRKLMFECLELKRIVDFVNIKIGGIIR